MGTYQTDSPVVFCIFNRPTTTRRVFEQIAQARPPALYIVADAPRPDKDGEAELCKAARQIAENVTWDCEITLDYAESNLGCRQRIYSGISNAFKKYEFAIILEDDCYPSNDFFRFIDTIRDRYASDPTITHISGTAFVRPTNPKVSYYVSNLPIIWGWATWRNTWQTFDLSMSDWPKIKEQLKLHAPSNSKPLGRLIKRMEKAYKGETSTWDYPYVCHTFNIKGHCISPTFNLISNIGFGEDSTLTANTHSLQANIPHDKLPPQIKGAPSTSVDTNYSNLQLKNCLYRRRKYQHVIHQVYSRLNLAHKRELPRPKRQSAPNEPRLINLS